MSKYSDKTNQEIVTLRVADLKTNIFVRKKLDDDRVLQFVELYEHGTELPPIKVVRGTMEIIDGRHRKAAHEFMDREHANCVLVEPMEKLDALMEAFSANFGGSLPPTRADVIFVMKQLIEQETGQKRIIDLFSQYYRPSQVKDQLKQAWSEISAAKMQRARSAVAHGNYTVKTASVEYGVDEAKLQEAITGVKKKRRANGTAELKKELSNRYRGNTHRTVAVFKDLLAKFEDGEIREKEVSEVLDHVEKLHKGAGKRVNGWRERFNALRGSVKARS